MNLITYRFGLDLAKHGSQVVLSGMKVGDTNRAIDVALSVNGEPFYLGAEHVATIRTKVYTDLEMYEFEDACQIRENRVFYILAPEILSYPGEIHAELVIGTEGTEIFSTARFVFFVKGEKNGEPELPENTYNSVLTALADSKDAKDKSIYNVEMDNYGNLVISLFDGTKYNVGNVVGPQGEKGEQGPQGERGEQGPQGERGEVDYSLVANALKGTASGAAVSMKDVSPLEHEIKVKISGNKSTKGDLYFEGVYGNEIGDTYMGDSGIYTVSDWYWNDSGELNIYFEDGYYLYVSTNHLDSLPEELSVGTKLYYDAENDSLYYFIERIDDFTAVTLTRYGKNLIDQEKFVDTSIPSSRMNACVKNENGNFYIEKSSEQSHFSAAAPVRIQPNTTFTLSFDLVSFSLNKEDGTLYPLIGVEIHFADGTYTNTASDRIGETGRKKIKTFTFPKEVTKLKTYIVPEPVVGSFIEFRDFQVELGGIATEYEPYKEPVSYTPNADGTVDGVKSLYPTTTLVTDTEGVTIEAEYNRDLNKAFAEIYQAIATMGAAAVTIPEEV